MNLYLRAFVLVSLLLVAPSTGAAGQVPSLLQTDLRLELTLHYDDGTIGGTATVTIKNVGIDPIDRVPLQLGRLMQVSAAQNGAGNPLPFTQDIVTYEDWPEFQICQIHIALASPLRAGESQSVAVRYGGTLVGYTETGMRYVRDRVDSVFTIIRTDALAIPTVGGPSFAALRAQPRGDFTFTARITVPAGFTVATGVAESERVASGQEVTWVFEGSRSVPFLNIAVAPYEVLETGGLRVYYFHEDSAGAHIVMNAIERATELFALWFGPLRDSARLHVIEIPEGWGSQASLTGGIIQTANTFRDAHRLPELYHELSHLWNVRDLDQPPCRWNEGLAMFLQERVDVELTPGEKLESRMAQAFESCRKLVERTPELTQVPFADYGRKAMTDYSYSTGEVMFYILFRVMGPSQFDAAMSGFLQTYGHSGSTTAEFADYLRGKSPGAVSRVLDDWLFATEWARRLDSGETLDEMISEYSRR